MKFVPSLKMLTLFVSLFCLSACDTSQKNSQTPPVRYTTSDVVLEKYNWRGDLPKANHVKIINPYGNISTRLSSLRQVELAGVIQKVGPNAPQPEVKIQLENDTTIIQVTYQNETIDNHGNRIGRFDLAVFVPKGIELSMQTSFGDIKAKKHASSINAQTDSGKISIMTSGQINAQTDTGDIQVSMTQRKIPGWLQNTKKRMHSLISNSGKIKVYAEQGIDFELNLLSKKSIKTKNDSLKDLIRQQQDEVKLLTSIASATEVINAKSQFGEIEFNFADLSMSSDPNEQHSSESTLNQSNPIQFNGDLRQLPAAEKWQPGDPITEQDDKQPPQNGDN